MSYRTIVESALSNAVYGVAKYGVPYIELDIPVSFQTYRGKSNKYVTYFCYNQQGEMWAENKEIATGFYIQINIWFDTSDYEALADQIREKLESIGFQGYTAQDLYENDTKIYHKAIRMNYTEYKKEGN